MSAIGRNAMLLYQSMAISRARRSSRRSSRRGVGAVAGGGAYGFLVRAPRARRSREPTLPVAGLPPALAGLRIGLLTDVHRSRWVSHDDVARAVDAADGEQPDLIVLGGDYVTWGDREYVGAVGRSARRRCRRRTASSRILGNHDDDRDMPAALGARGVQVLKDARTRLDDHGTKRSTSSASASGPSAPADIARARARRDRHRSSCSRTIRGGSTEAAALDVPLVLSGHTHGGQVVLPVLGAVAAQKFPVVAGVARRGRDDDVRQPRRWARSTCRSGSTARPKSPC